MNCTNFFSSIGVLTLSVICNTVLFRATRSARTDSSATAASAHLKAISASHSALVTILAAVALRQRNWRLPDEAVPLASWRSENLDDSANPMIQGRSRLANIVTAWEAGYLLYDTWAMTYALPRSVHLRPSRVLVSHHVLIASGLLCLQLYVARGRERGVRIILAFLLMNASNPLLHARWWARKSNRASKLSEAVFLATFAALRFGIVAWVLRQYGAYHRLGPLEVFGYLRTPCKAGTGTLVGLNAVWWSWMCKNFIRRCLARKTNT